MLYNSPNRATMSIWGMYDYDNTLFDNLHLPTGVDADEVKNNILIETAELQVLYPDFGFFKWAIGEWSDKELPVWEKILEMQNANYNPIENYDRYDTEVESADRAKENVKNDVVATTNSAKSKTVNNDINTSTNLEKVAGFNTDTLGVNSQNTASNSDTGESDVSGESTGASTQNTSDKGNETENRVKSLHSHGNIGVTTVAQMMREFAEVLPTVNTVTFIVESFKRRFCLLVY